ncbi:allantoate permease [Bisporella sp. PMI_857]|nr:allantoate permease [Bisporella sp. PMI_857]
MASSNEKMPVEAASRVSEVADVKLDNAFNFMRNLDSAALDIESVNLKALRWKIDRHIIPVMFCLYSMQFLDKVNINYAAVMGFTEDLNLKGDDFTNASSAFFIAYLIAEIPNGYILQKVPAGKWISLNVVLWGITTACIAATKNYRTLLAARIFLGMFEAAIAPTLMLISSQYYTRSEQGLRTCIWFCSSGAANVMGSLLSFGFQHVDDTVAHLKGWRVMFLVLGAITILVGVWAFFAIPDSPMKARFLTEREKVALLVHVGKNRTGVEQRGFKGVQLRELLLDAQIWLIVCITILISCSGGVVTSYSATVIRQLGYTSKEAALLNMPSGLLAIFFTLVVGYGIRYLSHRWFWLIFCCIPGIIGGSLMSFASSKPARLIGVYLVSSIIPTLIILYQWVMANVAGHTKRVVAIALVAGSFSVGNIIGPQTFRKEDAPEYHKAKVVVLATQSAAAVVTSALFGYYKWANQAKERNMRAIEVNSGVLDERGDIWGNLTDKENPEFRYVY